MPNRGRWLADENLTLFRHRRVRIKLIAFDLAIKRALADAQCLRHGVPVVVVALQQIGDMAGFGIRQ